MWLIEKPSAARRGRTAASAGGSGADELTRALEALREQLRELIERRLALTTPAEER